MLTDRLCHWRASPSHHKLPIYLSEWQEVLTMCLEHAEYRLFRRWYPTPESASLLARAFFITTGCDEITYSKGFSIGHLYHTSHLQRLCVAPLWLAITMATSERLGDQNEKLFYGVPLYLLVRHGLEILLRKNGYTIMLDLL